MTEKVTIYKCKVQKEQAWFCFIQRQTVTRKFKSFAFSHIKVHPESSDKSPS